MTQPVPGASKQKRFAAHFAHELQLRRLIPNLTAGLIIAILVIIFSISLASLVYGGDLSGFVSIGIVLTLIGAMVLGLIVALFSSYPGTIAQPQGAPAAILALITASIANTMPPGATQGEIILTSLAAIAVTAILTGLLFILLGYFALGDLIRFLPYPVLGGFLAGTGWLLVTGAITVMTDVPTDLTNLPILFQSDMWLRWLPALIFAGLMLVVLNRYSHYLIMPAMILGAVVLFYTVAWISDASIAGLTAQGWLLEPPEQGLTQSLTLLDLAQVNWQVILGQIGNVTTVLVVSVVGLLLNASGLELAVRKDIDLNRELRATGFGNLIAGLGGGLVGFLVLSETTLSHKIGGRSRLVGVIVAALCGIVLMWGMSVLYYFPKIILGSMLMLLGLGFLVEWVYRAWFKFSRIDYLIILSILIVISVVGFLQGVVLGIALAVVLFVVNYSRVNVVKHTLTGAIYQSRVTRQRAQRQILEEKGDEIYILQLQGFIFFGTANNLFNQVHQRIVASDLPRIWFVVLDFRQVTGLDSTATLSFTKMVQHAQTHQVALIFTNPTIENELPGQSHTAAKLFAQLEDVQRDDLEKSIHVFPDLDRGLEWCENQILGTAGVNLKDDQESLRDQLTSLLPEAANLDALLKYFEKLDVDTGYYLMKQGDPPEDLYFIESGQLTAQLEFPDRDPVRLETMRGGRVVGEIGFYLNQPRTAAVVTDEASTLYRLSRQTLIRMEKNDPEAASAFHQGIIRLVSERQSHLINTVNALQR